MGAYIEAQEGLFALWRYDQFPYLLGGKITHINDYGKVFTEEFGRYGFDPVKTLPVESGKTLLQELDLLKTAKEAEINEIDTKYQQLLKEKLDKFGIIL